MLWECVAIMRVEKANKRRFMYKLMIVDDEPKLRNGLAEFFPWEELGFSVVAKLENGRQALDYLRQFPVDVILADIKMPVLDGLELASTIAEEKLPIVVVLLSGYRDFNYAQRAIGYGVREYILKPAKLDKITEVFAKICEELAERETSPSGVGTEEGYYEMLIGKVKKYLRENLKTATLEKAALHGNISAGYLSKLFKQKTGQNFSEYLNELKMKKAAELLMDSEYKNYNIADILGYEDPSNFSRAFRDYYGVSPKSYKISGRRGLKKIEE